MNINQLLMFLIVGLLSAGVNFLTFGLSWNLIGLDYKISVSVAYVCSIITHFLGNRHLTFKSTQQPIFFQLKKYSVFLLGNYLITLLTIMASVELLHLSPYLGTVLAIGISVGLNYMISRLWVFKTS